MPLSTLHAADALGRWVCRSGKAGLRPEGAESVITDCPDLAGACRKPSLWVTTRDVVRGARRREQAGVQVSAYGVRRRNLIHFVAGPAPATADRTRRGTTIRYEAKARVRTIRPTLMNRDCTGTTWPDGVDRVTAPPPQEYARVPRAEEVEDRPPRTWRCGFEHAAQSDGRGSTPTGPPTAPPTGPDEGRRLTA